MLICGWVAVELVWVVLLTGVATLAVWVVASGVLIATKPEEEMPPAEPPAVLA
jgi:hypothetical protein